MLTELTQFGAENSSGFGALGIKLSSLIIQLIVFVLAYLVLRRFAFGPILKVLQERRETIESGVQLGEDMKRERAELDKTVAQTLRDARREADGIITNANDAAKLAIREAEDDARAKAANILAEAEQRIEAETVRARKALEKELVGLVADATEAIIDEKVDAKKDATLIERALREQRIA